MSILVEPIADGPLDQGDLLENITFCWADENGDAKFDTGLGLVISRPCVTIRRPIVQVAVVKSTKLEVSKMIQDGVSLDRVRKRMFAVRDGDAQPDTFYLGPLPRKTSRVAARLDHIVSIEVPTDSDARSAWVAGRRIAHLSDAFRRDLHVRMFVSIARQGFDDMGWYTDDDLEMLVNHGRSLAGKAQSEADKAKTLLQAALADNDTGRARGLSKKADDATTTAAEAAEELRPYKEEVVRRSDSRVAEATTATEPAEGSELVRPARQE